MISSDDLRDWWMFGAGRLWLARVLNIAGAVNFVLFVWMFLSATLNWLLFFFMSLTAFYVAAILKRKSTPLPAAVAAPGHVGEQRARVAAGALRAASPPPAPMFDREGRTPLERVFTEGEDEGEGASTKPEA